MAPITMKGCALLGLMLAAHACDRSPDARPPQPLASAEMASQGPPTARRTTAPAAAVTPSKAPVLDEYPWHDDATIEPLEAVDHLADRFEPPKGFSRVEVAPDGFGAWLRRIPLAAEGTPVLAYDGRTILPAGHRHLAAVTTLDVGDRDLQQCADAVMRLFAEWRWARGQARAVSFQSGFGAIPWARFLSGAEPSYDGERVSWVTSRRRAKDDHPSFRRYLDVVFTWANTGSLAGQARRPEPGDLRPGDFFILPGAPGHTVVVLDLARDSRGRRVALIGQSFMPAQRFQVLRPSRDQTWFTIDDEGVDTPFWRPFPFSSLRRLDGEG